MICIGARFDDRITGRLNAARQDQCQVEPADVI